MKRFLFTWARKCKISGTQYLSEVVDCTNGKEEALRRLAIQNGENRSINTGNWRLMSMVEMLPKASRHQTLKPLIRNVRDLSGESNLTKNPLGH